MTVAEKAKWPISMIPNALTMTGIGIGLWSIFLSLTGSPLLSIYCVIISVVIDGLDGYSARRLRCESTLGAKLDSISDFINFGIAPAIIVGAFSFPDSVLLQVLVFAIYAVCTGVRLLLFTQRKVRGQPVYCNECYFFGLPSTGAALLVLFPLLLNLETGAAVFVSWQVYIPWTALMGYLMLSTIPTIIILKSKSKYKKPISMALTIAILGLIAVERSLWGGLLLLDLVYLVSVPVTYWVNRDLAQQGEAGDTAR